MIFLQPVLNGQHYTKSIGDFLKFRSFERAPNKLKPSLDWYGTTWLFCYVHPKRGKKTWLPCNATTKIPEQVIKLAVVTLVGERKSSRLDLSPLLPGGPGSSRDWEAETADGASEERDSGAVEEGSPGLAEARADVGQGRANYDVVTEASETSSGEPAADVVGIHEIIPSPPLAERGTEPEVAAGPSEISVPRVGSGAGTAVARPWAGASVEAEGDPPSDETGREMVDVTVPAKVGDPIGTTSYTRFLAKKLFCVPK